MNELTGEVFTDVVETVSKESLAAAAVVTVVAAFWGGYGKGYHDGIKDEREYKSAENA